jgi:hypothetical protein
LAGGERDSGVAGGDVNNTRADGEGVAGGSGEGDEAVVFIDDGEAGGDGSVVFGDVEIQG